MSKVVADNDVVGMVRRIEQILRSEEWAEYTDAVKIEFLTLNDVGIPPDATDETVWTPCQELNCVLITGNRTGGIDSLENVISENADRHCQPVLTLSDPRRVLRDTTYAEATAVCVLDCLDRLDALQGVARLFIP
ncbi:MAG: hypothetical protein ACE5KM_11910 [Planctomycetaceae bacterium]